MLFKLKYHLFIYLIFSFFILIGCQLQEPSKNHGILFLKNRSDKLQLNVTNKNDVLQIIGYPHSKSINNKDEWMYIERTLTKGEFHKIGQHVLKSNNVLVLDFDKYGILNKKTFLDKNSKNKVNFSEFKTANILTKKSFVQKFLGSIKTKMYGNK